MSDFRIQTCVLGGFSTNCYIVYRKDKKEAVIVDPADNGAYILNKCYELQVEPVAVLLTHGHADHIMAMDDIRRAFHCKVYACRAEEKLLSEPSMNLSGMFGLEAVSKKADVWLEDGEILQLLGCEWQVIGTPGHTKGSACYYIPSEEVLISGDTLFADSLGRTDLPTGNVNEIVHSIAEILFKLPDHTMVYPGHGDPTSIGHEKVYNPVVPYWKKNH